MIIQSKRIWVLGQFIEAQLELEDGKIKMFWLMALNRLTRTMVKDELYLDSLTFIHMVPMALTPMMQKKKACETG